MNFLKFIKYLIIVTLIVTPLSGCKKVKWEEFEGDGKKRARKNVEEGKGITNAGGLFKSGRKKGGGSFEFASSNELWRATLDTLDFMSFSNVDYSGGLIITDWYSESENSQSIKITVRFLSNQIRSDAITVIVHKKKCNNTSSTQCSVAKINNSALEDEIRLAILKKATLLKKDSLAKRRREYRKKYGETDLTKEKRYID